MAFVLAMLKIIGIIVAVVLAVVVIAAAVVFVVPFKYELAAEKYEKIKADGKIKWLFGMLDVSFLYDEKTELSVKLFGHKLYPKEKKEAAVKERGGKETSNEAEKSEEKPAEKRKAEVKKIPKKAVKPKDEPMAKKDVTPKVIRVKMTEPQAEEEEEPKKMTKREFLLGYVKDMPFEEKKAAISELLSLLKGVIKHICPQKIRLYAVIGLSDPATVGYILAAGGIARGFTGQDITIVGDFENERLDGEGEAAGQIRLGRLLLICLRLVLSRPVRRFIMRFLKVRGELI